MKVQNIAAGAAGTCATQKRNIIEKDDFHECKVLGATAYIHHLQLP
jgi:hypothetical protein